MSDLTHLSELNLGTFGEFDTPVDLFDEDELITIPITEQKTAYLAGMFYTLEACISNIKKEGCE